MIQNKLKIKELMLPIGNPKLGGCIEHEKFSGLLDSMGGSKPLMKSQIPSDGNLDELFGFLVGS